MKKLIEDVVQFQRETFPSATHKSKLFHLLKEVEELIEELETFESGGGSMKRIESEYADCFILLIGSFSYAGFEYKDIERIVREKLEINKKRKWGKPDSNGVVLHIKEENE